MTIAVLPRTLDARIGARETLLSRATAHVSPSLLKAAAAGAMTSLFTRPADRRTGADARATFEQPWAVMTFDSALAPPKRDALWTMLQKLRFYRADRWLEQSLAPAAPITWALTNDGAKATLDAGGTAELSLKRQKGQHPGPGLSRGAPSL